MDLVYYNLIIFTEVYNKFVINEMKQPHQKYTFD